MYQVEERPTAFITVNKGRRKIKDGKFVYLQSEQEFEIELFNPTSQTVLAKIKMNGKLISTSGIVLRPGERVFLDRFLDTPEKFKFDTYEVSGNNSSVQKAIAKNGLVQVDFYNEDTTIVVNNTPNINIRTPWPNNNNWGGTYYFNNTDVFGTTTVGSTLSDDSVTLTSLNASATLDSLGFMDMDQSRSITPRQPRNKVKSRSHGFI